MRRKNWIITCSIAAFLAASLIAIASPYSFTGNKSSCSKKKTDQCIPKNSNTGEMLQDQLARQFIINTPLIY
ncbi:MAG: hypothetical protein WBC06_02880 [Chitinophagaceae bacterium]